MTMQFDFNRDRQNVIPDEMRLELGRYIAQNYIQAEGMNQEACSSWLGMIGFDRVEWFGNDHDILLLCLWRVPPMERVYRYGSDPQLDEFIIEFIGTDDQIVTVFNFAKEAVVEPVLST